MGAEHAHRSGEVHRLGSSHARAGGVGTYGRYARHDARGGFASILSLYSALRTEKVQTVCRQRMGCRYVEDASYLRCSDITLNYALPTAWMKKIGLVMQLRELGVKEDMFDAIADSTLIMEGGYKVLTKAEAVQILKESY